MPCGSLASPTTIRSGPEAVRASPSPQRASAREQATSAICGLTFTDLFGNVVPLSSLESKSPAQRWSENNPELRRIYAREHRRRRRAMQLIRRARERAKKKRMAFELDFYEPELQRRIDAGFCEVTGLPLNLDGGRTWDSPSIDRIDTKQGYLYRNIRIVCHGINTAMNDWGEQCVVQMALAILSQRKKRSNDLSRRIAERLRQQLDGRGSTMFDLTWSEVVTPSGHVFSRLAASALRISGNGSTGWPTTTSEDARSSRSRNYSTESGRHSGTTLTDAARLAGWPTPRVSDEAAGRTLNEKGQQVFGVMPSGSPASTARRGQLSPLLSCWLQGFPLTWVSCAPAGRSRTGSGSSGRSETRLSCNKQRSL